MLSVQDKIDTRSRKEIRREGRPRRLKWSTQETLRVPGSYKYVPQGIYADQLYLMKSVDDGIASIYKSSEPASACT